MSKARTIGTKGENLVADYLGLERTKVLGEQIYDLDGDAFNGLVFVEVKTGKQCPSIVKKLPALFVSALEQVAPHTNKEHQLPVAVMVPDGVGIVKLPDEAIVLMSLKNFKQLLDGGKYGLDAPIKVTIEMPTGEKYIMKGFEDEQ